MLFPTSFSKLIKTSTILGLPFVGLIGYGALLFDDGGYHEVNFDLNPTTEDYIDIFDGASGTTTVVFTGGTFSGNHPSPPPENSDYRFHEADIAVFESSEGIIAGSTLQNDIIAADGSTLIMNSGRIMDDVYIINSATGDFFGGHVDDDLNVYDQGSANILGGSFGEDIEANDSSRIFISGGSFGTNPNADTGFNSGFGAFDSAKITILGSSFFIDDTAVGDSLLTVHNTIGANRISGILEDGNAFSMPFTIEDTGSINLVAVPEPSTYLAIVGMFGTVFIFRRKRSYA